MTTTASETSSAWRRLLSNALVVALAGGFANLLNLGVTFFIARLLAPNTYSAYSQMVGVFFVVALPGSALSVAVVRRATYYIVRGEEGLTRRWEARLRQRIVRAAALGAVLTIPLSVVVANWLGHRAWIDVWLVILAGIVYAVVSVDRALLQSRQRYNDLALNFVVEGVARTIFILAGTTQGVAGYGLGLLTAELITRWHAARLTTSKEPVDTSLTLTHTGVSVELLVAFWTLGLMAVLQFIDVFTIGHANPHGGGSYTAISQIAKTLVYAATILSSFLLPEAALANRKGGDVLKQLGVVGVILSLPASLLLIVSALIPDTLLIDVFGVRYSHASSALMTLVLAMVVLSVSTVLVTFLLGDGARWPTLWLTVCVGIGFVWIVGAHGAWRATAQRDLEVQCLVVVGLLVAAVYRLRTRLREEART